MRIDVHHHWMPKLHYDSLSYMVKQGEIVEPFVKDTGERGFRIIRDGVAVFIPNERYFQLDERIREMDEAGIDVAVLSLGLWYEWVDIERCRFINEELSKVVQLYPERLVGLAHVPVSEEGAEELDRAVKDLGLRGVCITTHQGGAYPDEESYFALYKKVNELGVPVFVHPASIPADNASLKKYNLYPLGRILDNGLVTCRILLSNILDVFQNLSFIISHLGGSFLMLNSYPGVKARGITYSKDKLSRIFFDTAPSLHPRRVVEAAVELVGAEQLVFGTDYPTSYDMLRRGVSLIQGLDIDDSDKEKIFWKNAARILGIKL